MFNHPALLYWCWKDAKREARKNPNNDNGGGLAGCLIVIGILFIICLWKAAFEVGGQGIIIALLITLGVLKGLFGK